MNLKVAVILLAVLVIPLANASEEADFEKAELLVQSKVSCEDLSLDDLELIGDYYMEQMHPGPAHERMDAMMGGEGSATLRQVHINIAQSFYCGNSRNLDNTTRKIIMGGPGVGMMNYEQDGSTASGNYQSRILNGGGFGMMGGYPGYGMMGGNVLGASILWLLYVALAAFVFGIIFWWTQKLVEHNAKKTKRK